MSQSPSPSATPPVDGPVLMVSSSFPRWHGDAAGHFVARLAGALVERGVAVRALVPHEAGAARRETLAGVEVTRLRYFRPERLQRLAYGSGVPANLRRRPVAWLNLPFFLAAFLGAIARSGDRHRLVHAHWGVLGALAVLTRPVHRRPVVVTVHGSDLHPEVAPLGVRRLTRLAIRRADAVLTPSAAFERECRTIGARDSRFLPHGVDSPDASRLAEVLAARRERAERGVPLRLVTVGRLVPERRHDLLLAALAGVAPTKGGNELVVVGEGPERRRIEERARALAPACSVQLVGQVAPDSIQELLAGADLYVSATSVETFGLATVEAAGCALPIVATAVGYPAELLGPDAARLVPVADVASLRAAIEGLSSDASTRLTLGHRARDRFDRAELSWARAAERTAAVYRELLERDHGHG